MVTTKRAPAKVHGDGWFGVVEMTQLSQVKQATERKEGK